MEWNEMTVKTVCQEFASRIGQPFGNMKLVRFGENCIYYLPERNIVFRAHRPTKALQEIDNEISICQFLTQQGFPSPSLLKTPKPQPYEISGMYISAWKWLPHDSEQKVSWTEFGRLISTFHDITKPYDYTNLPRYNPFPKMRKRLEMIQELNNVKQEEISCLKQWVDKLYEKFKEFDTCFLLGVIHGDAHTGNVVVSNGQPYLLDFENVSYGDQVWDLIPMIVSMRRFNLKEDDVKAFFEGYGQDIFNWGFLADAVSIRELYMTLWLFQNVDQNPMARKQLDIRMLNWLSENGDSSKWGAF